VPLCRLALWLDPRYRAAMPCDDVQFKELGREVRACIFLRWHHVIASTRTLQSRIC
jgi:hypothetical protein